MSRQLSRETRISLVLGLGIIIGFGVVLTQLRPTAPANAGAADRFTLRADDQPVLPFAPPRRVAAPVAVRRGAGDGNLAGRRRARAVAPQRRYVVRPNDSLTRIAQRVYGRGNAKYYKRIYEANRGILPNERTLRVGQVLVIPPLSDPGTSSIARRQPLPRESMAYNDRAGESR